MKKKLIRALCLLTVVVFALGITACKKDEEKPKQEEEKQEVVVEPEKDQEPEEPVEPEMPANQNLLTGLADLSEKAIGKRPVAVMINNVNAALPQYGIEQADVIFEMHVEGDLTRLMALYADYTAVPKICAVRSCRYYYPAISEGFDAIYVHWGMDETMRDYVEAIDSARYDGMDNPSGMFGRDQNRLDSGYSLEHTAYFDGTKLADVTASQKVRTDLLENKQETAFLFNGLDEQIKPEGDACATVDVDFGAATAKFTYDEATNTYLKQINGKKHSDGVTGAQLAFTNVIILETDISIRTDYGHKQIDWKGSKDSVGYYVSNGAVQKIHWSKADEKSYLKFYDEKGEELSINRGKSYIAFNYAGQTTFK